MSFFCFESFALLFVSYSLTVVNVSGIESANQISRGHTSFIEQFARTTAPVILVLFATLSFTIHFDRSVHATGTGTHWQPVDQS